MFVKLVPGNLLLSDLIMKKTTTTKRLLTYLICIRIHTQGHKIKSLTLNKQAETNKLRKTNSPATQCRHCQWHLCVALLAYSKIGIVSRPRGAFVSSVRLRLWVSLGLVKVSLGLWFL